ncbi:hypothetical protein LB462_07355, partial [Phyllobacterium sp. KW56]|nr:hypothetical protein [Phyllobacterium sp. KW56]
MEKRSRPVLWLLLIPYIGLLWVPFYNFHDSNGVVRVSPPNSAARWRGHHLGDALQKWSTFF